MLAAFMKLAVLVEVVLIGLYWYVFVKDHFSLRSATTRTIIGWTRIGKRLPKFLTILYGLLGIIGISYFFVYILVDSGTSALQAGTPILIFLPLVVYFLFVPVKTKIDTLNLRKRIRNLSTSTVEMRGQISHRSRVMLGWFVGLSLFFLLVGLANLKIDPPRAIAFFIGTAYGLYWLSISIFMPDLKINSQHIDVRKKKWELVPFYRRYEFSDYRLCISGNNLKISKDGKDLETIRIDRISDTKLAVICDIAGART